jgi:hypothetical protein
MPNSANPFSFFTNSQDPNGTQLVQAPAYSITKVLTTAAIVLVPIGTVVVDGLTKLSFTSWQVVTLALGVMLFGAILGSADVLSRSRAAAAKLNAQSAASTPAVASTENGGQSHAVPGQIIPFKGTVKGHTHGASSKVSVVGLCAGDVPCLLVQPMGAAGGSYLLPATEVTIEQS